MAKAKTLEGALNVLENKNLWLEQIVIQVEEWNGVRPGMGPDR